jgi:hypothetical protein
MIPIKDRVEYPWAYADNSANPHEVQKILNDKCVRCHDATKNGNADQTTYRVTMTNQADGTMTTYDIPRLDLSSRPITVTYDRRTQAWPASYVSLFYPAALEMEMGMGTTIEGQIPPKWAIPSDARHSVLIEKLNVTSAIATTPTYAWPLGQPFSDTTVQGGSRSDHAAFAQLTRDELVTLIRAIDMGGQFYARQNTQCPPETPGCGATFTPFVNDPVTGNWH